MLLVVDFLRKRVLDALVGKFKIHYKDKDMFGWLVVETNVWRRKLKYRMSIYIHIFPTKSKLWGFEEIWYDVPYRSFGFGPLLLIHWC